MDSMCTVDDIPLPCVQAHVHTYTVHVHVSERYHRCCAIYIIYASCFTTRNYSTSTKYLYIYSVLYTTGGGILFILPSYLTSYTGTNARIVVLHIHSYHLILPLSKTFCNILTQVLGTSARTLHFSLAHPPILLPSPFIEQLPS